MLEKSFHKYYVPLLNVCHNTVITSISDDVYKIHFTDCSKGDVHCFKGQRHETNPAVSFDNHLVTKVNLLLSHFGGQLGNTFTHGSPL